MARGRSQDPLRSPAAPPARPDDPDPIAVADRLHSAAIRLLRRLRLEDAASGLTGPRASALSVIVFGRPLTMSELAAAEQVRPPTISRLVAELEREGLVQRVTDPEDRRVQRVHPTEAGRRLLEQGRARRVSKLAERVGELPAGERKLLARAAEVLMALAAGDR